jgi:hypothetical protein
MAIRPGHPDKPYIICFETLFEIGGTTFLFITPQIVPLYKPAAHNDVPVLNPC